MEIISYPDDSDAIYIKGDEIEQYYLRDICRFSNSDNHVQLAGFSCSGKGWVEWSFVKSKVRIEGEPDI